MTHNKVHYEILGKKAANWTILGVIPKREEAMKKAEEIWTGGKYSGVRILKESHDYITDEFSTIEIFSRGSNRKKSKYDETGTLSPCLTPDDLYTHDGRRSIWDLLGNTLEQWSMTTTELLYSLNNYDKLDNSGTLLQNAVQRVAISIEDNTDSVQERMRKLYRVINMAVSIIKAEAPNVPSLATGRLAPLISELDDKQNKTFLLSASMVDYISPAKTIIDKFGRIIVFPSKKRPDWVMVILDRFISEFLMHSRLISHLLDDDKNLDRGDFMLRLLYLQDGKIEDYYKVEEKTHLSMESERLNLYMGEELLPLSKKKLVELIHKELLSNRPINSGGIVSQLGALRKLIDTCYSIITDEGVLDQLDDAIKTRSSRLINSQVIGELLYDIADPFHQMDLLLELENLAMGNSNKRTLANFMLPIMSRPDYEAIFLGMDANPLDCMRKLVTLQGRVLNTGMTEMHKRKIAERLDSFSKVIMNNSQILKKVHELKIPLQEKTLRLLKMIADGYFTDGESRQQAEAQVRLYMKQPSFTQDMIKGLSRKDQENTLITFRKLLLRAKIA